MTRRKWRAPQADQSKRARVSMSLRLRPRPSVAQLRRRRNAAVSRTAFACAFCALTLAAYALILRGAL